MAIMNPILSALVLGSTMLFSQQTQFEVAAIHQSPPLRGSSVRIGMKEEHGRVNIGLVSLKGPDHVMRV
jgi:hypothetical protein